MSSFPDVRGVLFDLDGTLLDTQRLILVSFRHAVETVLGKSMPDELLMAKVGQPLTVQMWDFTDDQEVHDELLAVYRDYNARVHDDLIRIFPGVPELLADLRETGLPFGVVTSKRHEAAVRGLATFGLDGAFDLLIGSPAWPAPRGVRVRGRQSLRPPGRARRRLPHRRGPVGHVPRRGAAGGKAGGRMPQRGRAPRVPALGAPSLFQPVRRPKRHPGRAGQAGLRG